MAQDRMEVVQVLLEAATIYKDVVEVYYYILIEHIEKDLVHQHLEGSRGISEAEQHHYPFKKTISGQKSTTMLVLRGDPDLIVPCGQVYLCKVACCKQTIKQVLNIW